MIRVANTTYIVTLNGQSPGRSRGSRRVTKRQDKKNPRAGGGQKRRGGISTTQLQKISISLQNPAVEVFYLFNFSIRQLVSDVASQIEYYALSAVFAFYERRNRQY